MDEIFIQTFIPNATRLDCNIGKGINCYEKANEIFVFADAALSGPITKKIKERAIKILQPFRKEIVCVSIYAKKNNSFDPLKVVGEAMSGLQIILLIPFILMTIQKV